MRVAFTVSRDDSSMRTIRLFQYNRIMLTLFALVMGLCVVGTATVAKALEQTDNSIPNPTAYYIDGSGCFGTIFIFYGGEIQISCDMSGMTGLGDFNGTLYTVSSGTGGTEGQLYSINTQTGQTTPIGSNSTIHYLSFGSTTTGLYATGAVPDDSNTYFYSINPATGVATQIGGALPVNQYGSGISYVLSTGSPVLYATGYDSSSFDYQLYTFDTTSGVPAAVGASSGDADYSMASIAYVGGVLFGFSNTSGTLERIDTASGVVTLQAQPGDLGIAGLDSPVPPPGSLTVTISAASAGATWNLDGGTTWYASGAVVTNVSAGSHTVAFSSVPGLITPSNLTANITGGQTNSLTVFYWPPSGSVTVKIWPAAAVTAGAMWNVDGGTWLPSGRTVPDLSLGLHTLNFKNIPGYPLVISQTFNISSNGQTISLNESFPTGSLTVTISPPGAVSAGATWTVDNGNSQVSGATVSNLGMGLSAVSFNSVPGWTAPSSQIVTIGSGQTASATGIYTPVAPLAPVAPVAPVDDAGFTASKTSGKAPLAVHFAYNSTGSVTKCLWNFGDGHTSKLRSPSHTYSKAGTYTVTLTVTGAWGTYTSTQADYIKVYSAPKDIRKLKDF